MGDLIGTEVAGKPVLRHGSNTPGTVSWQIDSGAAQDVSDGVSPTASSTVNMQSA
jgi:hypothetical protein